MNFDFSDEQKQLRDEARRYLAEHSSPKAVRAVLEGGAPFDRALWKGLAGMGFLGVAIPEEFGGSGAGHLELCVIAEEMGRALAPVPFSSSIYLAAEAIMLAGSDEQKRRLLPGISSGDTIGTLALFEGPGNPSPKAVKTVVSNGKLSGTKIPVADGDLADIAIVAARTGATGRETDVGLFIVDLKGKGVSRKTLANVDPSRNQAEIVFDNCEAEPLGASGEGWSTLMRVLDRAAVLMAFEQVGGADRSLEMGRDYALDRIAFGRPIGSFQAVKHLLADMYVSATLARSNAYYGAWALSTNAAELPEAAATARISATQAFQHCSKNNIQVHGGMGFTWEFDCHLYYRRSNALALVLGSQSYWEDLLIDRMRTRNAA
ncbi:acyl-CoA/acyl-ACP dehydrogenase [Bradyrhizobium sp. U87765 SZCCT0131]|uniref:acyl-CoA dehydrogenase family protein n=1 Tax=unclassified Bradyrhizobium TaxID=2631580 RepID=UPI001BAA8404|nr:MULTISPECIES: acyl-CoA dehydrogenase family protein [unclassified Bradyrhizobium]MBR1217592.1 acyl-CoA/acyl-ACP dehydrogenase [Bradyrhizobium sp. U87765 SZCCT0131]MBR1264810.1 acyl-CoA/acyl-ACP dehydrogenase [Bradyrhizobium sp. U87765 SZCCT0134]MBR1304792.1 acyl-CoA/acyl-ACP dehydrogenase [Bradyrhizobium sp. U87765 SZCCT0110]MBR1320579.1 acyl-CoA/acyl-ACP dehydrogenase [Bradyrhizobium sp. U87765 SZCCT0109]MBR1348999.1 acyl-CoA/acyl-ACP dehydrogenase [Bradyrhizobium sp. U87765 SZCCT0048]